MPVLRILCAAIFFLPSVSAFAQVTVRTVAEAERLRAQALARAADESTRERLVNELIERRESPGRELDSSVRTSLVRRLMNQTRQQLEARLATGTLNEDPAENRRRDLLYTALPQPCRVIDTRIGEGALPGGQTRSFKVAGEIGFEEQGGTAGGCGVPVGATAALLNFVAVSPTGAGNLRGSAYPRAVPAIGSVINYAALAPQLNIANGLQFPLCNPVVDSCEEDINLLANGASVHLVVDALGYYMPALALKPILSQHTNVYTTTIANSCTFYQSSSLTLHAPAPGKVWVRGTVMLQVTHPADAEDEIHVAVATSQAHCPGILDITGAANLVYTAPWPAGTHYVNVPVDGVFNVAAGPATFYVNGKDLFAGNDTASFWFSTITALFVPD